MTLSQSLMIISVVGILLMCLAAPAEAQINPNDRFYPVRPTDPAPSNIHTNCYRNIIFMKVCLHWTDPFAVLEPNSVLNRRPYSRYTLTATSSLGGSLTLPNLIQQEITLTQDSAPNLIAPGATVTFRVAGQQIDNPAALSQFSPIPLILIFPTANITTAIPIGGLPPEPGTTNGLGKIGCSYNAANSTVDARWNLGTRPVVKVTGNLYCFRSNDATAAKVNSNAATRIPTATRLAIPFPRRGSFACKCVVTALYDSGVSKNFRRDITFTTASA